MGRHSVDYPRNVRRRLADGTWKDYYYDRKTGKPVAAPTPESEARSGRAPYKPRVSARYGVMSGAEMSFGKLIAHFEASAEWTQFALATQAIYHRCLTRRELAPLMPLKVAEITQARLLLIRQAIAERGAARHAEIGEPPQHATGAANIFVNAIGAVFSWGRANRQIGPLMPTRGIRAYPVQRGHEIWSDDEIDLWLARAPLEIGRAIRLGLATAARIGDLIRLSWDDWDGQVLRFAPQKTRRIRQKLAIPLTQAWPRILAGWRHEGDGGGTILRDTLGRQWSDTQAFDRLWSRTRERFDLPRRTMHGLRATAACRLIEAGVPTRSVMALTGHTSEKTFSVYLRFADQQRLVTAAAAALGAADWGVR